MLLKWKTVLFIIFVTFSIGAAHNKHILIDFWWEKTVEFMDLSMEMYSLTT